VSVKTELEYVHVCVVCGACLREAHQVCGERCFKALVRGWIS
jgi:predicted nucleic acid-binding Zn ribbon protein